MSVRSSACRVGMVSGTEARITFVSKSIVAPTVTCSGGSISQTAMSDRYNTGGNSIAVTTITITGLSAETRYTYSIVQGGDDISGSFKTAPNSGSNFSFILSSCDNPKGQSAQNPWPLIRELMSDAEFPLAAMFHIDDVSYVDGITINDGVYVSTGKPQDTGLGRDYACGWANYYGILAGGGASHGTGKYANADRQYVYQNLPSFVSGGDHAIEDNHCRGALDNGVPKSDYHGCDRTPGGLEEVAKAEWDAFFGNGNPDPLRADKFHWGAQLGSVKFALFDYSLYSQPYDTVLATDVVGYGAEQIGDITTYMSDSNVQWKCFLMESPPTTYGQPWLDWHATEAGGWKTAFDADNNLNGVNGNSFIACGDNHALYAVSYDTVWNFCSGILSGAVAVGYLHESPTNITSLSGSWSGKMRFSQHSNTGNGDRLLGGFWHFKVFGNTKIEATCYNATGSKFAKGITLVAGATDNQWTMPVKKFS